jgi:hypothetical protein
MKLMILCDIKLKYIIYKFIYVLYADIFIVKKRNLFIKKKEKKKKKKKKKE